MLYLICISVDTGAVFKALKSTSWTWLICAFVIILFQPLLASLRIYTYLLAGSYGKPFRRCLNAVMSAICLNSVLPAKGGDLVKVSFLQDHSDELAPLAGIVLLERLFDVLVLCLIAIVCALYIGNITILCFAVVVIVAPVSGLLLLGRADKVPIVGKKLLRLADACRTVWSKPLLVCLGCLTAVFFWSTNMVIMFCLLKSVGASVRIVDVAATTPLAILVGLFPISISGMGTRDSALVFLIPEIAKEVVYAGTFLYTFGVYWFLALLGLIFLGCETLRITTKRTQANQDALKKNVPVKNC